MSDPRDLLTRREAKKILRIGEGDSSDDDLLDTYITAVSRELDKLAGHTVALAVTDELHDGTNRSGRGWRDRIILRHRPVMVVTSAIEYSSGTPTALVRETTTQQPHDGYLLTPYDPEPGIFSGKVQRRCRGVDALFAYGRQNLAFTYTAGRVATTTEVDPRFKRAAAITLQNLWGDREPGLEQQGEFDVPAGRFPTFAVPNAAKQLLSEEIGQNKVFGIA